MSHITLITSDKAREGKNTKENTITSMDAEKRMDIGGLQHE